MGGAILYIRDVGFFHIEESRLCVIGVRCRCAHHSIDTPMFAFTHTRLLFLHIDSKQDIQEAAAEGQLAFCLRRV